MQQQNPTQPQHAPAPDNPVRVIIIEQPRASTQVMVGVLAANVISGLLFFVLLGIGS